MEEIALENPNIYISDKAVRDIIEIYKYVKGYLKSDEDAEFYYNNIMTAISALPTVNKFRYIMQDEPFKSMLLREFPVGVFYSVYYTLKGDSVYVFRVLHIASAENKVFNIRR